MLALDEFAVLGAGHVARSSRQSADDLAVVGTALLLAVDRAFGRLIAATLGSKKNWDRGAALTSRRQSFEAEFLSSEENLLGLMAR